MAFSPASLLRSLTGPPVSNREAGTQKLKVWTGVPAMGLDALSSASYGPEAALTILGAAGAAGSHLVTPVMGVIIALLVILWMSYRQTVAAYPNNGGSYIVARENLGPGGSLLAAAALMIDYILTVAVGISAGVGALTSALPSLQPYTVWFCLGILALITLVNLRGTRESGVAWAGPTYLFILCLGIVIVCGVAKTLGGGPLHPAIAPPGAAPAVEALTGWLILRAFASGCTAMTGVEAISNGVGSFEEPRVERARLTMAIVVLTLATMLGGIAYLAQHYDISAMDQTKPDYQSVISQLAGAVFGHGWFYYLLIGAVLAVLCLSANTSFVGFPRLCSLVAQDKYLPHTFALPDRRLVLSASILFMAAFAGALLVAFDGITDRLIPLYAIGAFLAFTLSQAGMAMHWRRELREKPSGAIRVKLFVNGFGALCTTIALAVILVAKFVEGAWLTVLMIPCVILLLRGIHAHYRRVDDGLLLQQSERAIDLRKHREPLVLIPLDRWDRLARKAVEQALRLSGDVVALHVTSLQGPDGDDERKRLKSDWDELVAEPARRKELPPPKLVFDSSPYRSMAAPLLRRIEKAGKNRSVVVVLPELVERSVWGALLHTHRERRLRAQLLRYGGPRVAVMCVPWVIDEETPETGIAAEEE